MKTTLRLLVILFFGFGWRTLKAEGFLYLPLKGKTVITCDFQCCDFYKNCNHQAIDWDTTDETTKVFASDDGIVVQVGSTIKDKAPCGTILGYGNYILIRHPNNYTTLYAHLKYGTIKVKVGDKVSAGQEIAIADNIGCLRVSDIGCRTLLFLTFFLNCNFILLQ